MTGSVLITGGNGFVGRHLARSLVGAGHAVRTLDICTGPDLDGVDAIFGDVRDRRVLKEVMDDVEVVFHLASVVGVEACLAQPLETIDVAVNGTMAVLEVAQLESAKVVLVSSSEVLGINPNLPWDEGAERVLGPTTVPRWGYGSAKAVAEHLAFAWVSEHGLDVSVARPFNVYGPGQHPSFVVPSIIRALLAGEPAPVAGPGTATRAFTYVDDLVDGLRLMAAHAGEPRVFHLGATEETSINDLVDLIHRLLGRTGTAERRPARHEGPISDVDVPRRVPDTDAAERSLGWRATTSLEVGLRATIESLRDEMSELGTVRSP